MSKTKMWIVFLAGVIAGHVLTRALSVFRVFAPVIVLAIIVLAVWLFLKRRPNLFRPPR